jgi:lipopolysaccharide transport system permease protein
VFNNIAKISTNGIPAPLFYLAGTTLWNYFQACFTSTSNTFVSNAGIFGKVYFPRLVSPISIVISNLLKFGIQMLMFLCFWLYYFFQGVITPSPMIVLMPVLLVLMAGLAFGVGIIFSSLTTKYRDFTFLLGFGVSLLMYASPVIYPSSAIPQTYRPFLAWNPIAPIIEAFRFIFTGAGSISWVGLGYSSAFVAVSLLIGILLFNKVEKTFMDTV